MLSRPLALRPKGGAPSARVGLAAACAASCICLGLLAARPLYGPELALLQARGQLTAAARDTPLPGRAPPLPDMPGLLQLLDVDPILRASMATYDAALLRPLAARTLYEPSAIVTAREGAAVEIALAQADAILRAASPPRRRPLSRYARAPGAGATDEIIRAAAATAGVDPGYLLRTASRESSFNAYAMARDTTARGLFQFIDQTWLLSVAKWGTKHGLGSEAAAIRVDSRGRAYVPDASLRRRILLLRFDPWLSARLAAEFAAENDAYLHGALRRPPSSGELYAAHLLGPGGAVRLIQTAYARPDFPAATLLPAAASKNRRLFYRSGAPRSASELLLLISADPD